MRTALPVLALLLSSTVAGQEWLRYRGPGDLLPPQLGGDPGSMADLTHWNFAWEFQRDAVQARTAAPGPDPDATLALVLPSLRAAADAEDAEVALLGTWALARAGRQHERAAESLRAAVLGGGLRRRDAAGEVAVLALGLAARGDRSALACLTSLAHDTASAREQIGLSTVPERTRCFALYGLGLAAENHGAGAVQFLVLAAVERLLLHDADTPSQVRIAALHALALVRLDQAPDLPGPALRLLEQQWSRGEPADRLSVRAQVPLAAAAMLQADDDAEPWRERLHEALLTENTPHAVRRSSAQALGRLCRPDDDDDSADARYSEALRRVASGDRDQQTRHLALFALGLIGGSVNRAWLEQRLTAPKSVLYERGWICLGVGCGMARRGETTSESQAALLLQVARTTRHPNALGGVVVGIGLARVPDATQPLLELLQVNRQRDPAAAAICTTLGALDAVDASEALRDLATSASFPEVFREAMRAYAAVGGESAPTTLQAWLLDREIGAGRRHAAATALRGNAAPALLQQLMRVLADPQTPIEERRLAAFAIGSLCDGAARDWSATLAAAIDYRSATPVLVGRPNGVLRLP